MALNPNIILAGQGIDTVGQMGRGNALAQQSIGMNQDRERNALYREHGAGIAAGDQASINALAAIDPTAAQAASANVLGMDATRLGMDNTRLGMQATQQQMDILSREEQRAIESQAAQMTAAERAAEAAQIEAGVASALQAQTAEQWDAIVAPLDPSLVGQFENREMIAGRYMSVADSLKRFDERNAVPDPPADPAAIAALKFRAAQAGLQEGTPEYQQFMLDGGTKSGEFYMETRPDGTQVVSMGGKPAGDGRMDPTDPAAMISTIDSVLSDEALDTSTGIMSWRQAVPGTGAYRFGTKVAQLQGQAFLQAFESLKGAGQITEIEGAKATAAIGRLDSGQSPGDYREALNELRTILETAQSRAPGIASSASEPVTIDGYTIRAVD